MIAFPNDRISDFGPASRSFVAKLKRPIRRQVARLAPGLTAKQIRLLRQSFALVEPKAGIAGLVFYRQLFTLDPSLRKLFQTSIDLQGRKLMESLGYTVATFENSEMLVP